MVDLTIGLITGLPAYGGVENFISTVLADIDTTPQVIPATSGAVPFPQGVVQDFDNNGLIFGEEGVWNISLSLSMTFLGINGPRAYGVQFYNATKDEVIVTPIVSVGRNAEGSTPAANLILDVQEPAVGNLFQMRLVSVADVFTTVASNFYSLNVIRIDVPRTAARIA